jgi:hypothetical protein
LIVTEPFSAASVTGNAAAALGLAELGLAELVVVELLVAELLAAELQPASNAAAVMAANIAPILFIVCATSSRDREGRRPSAGR